MESITTIPTSRNNTSNLTSNRSQYNYSDLSVGVVHYKMEAFGENSLSSRMRRIQCLASLWDTDGLRLVARLDEPALVEAVADLLLQRGGLERRLPDGMPDHGEPRSRSTRRARARVLRRHQLRRRTPGTSADELRESLVRWGALSASVLLGHRDRRAPVMGIVGAEGHHDAARHLVGKEMLQLAEEGGLGPHVRPESSRRTPARSRGAVTVTSSFAGRCGASSRHRRGCRRRSAPRSASYCVVPSAPRAHRRHLLQDTRPPGVAMKRTVCAVVGLVAEGGRLDDDVRDAERPVRGAGRARARCPRPG